MLIALAVFAGILTAAAASRPAHEADAAISAGRLPPGYRDWRLISVAREEGDLDDIRAVLGNDTAIKAYRDAKPPYPYPDGTIIARLAWSFDASEENNKSFGRRQSFVAGHPKNGAQFMVLADPRPHVSKIYHLSGAQSANMHFYAQEYSEALGRTITFQDLPVGPW